MPCRYSNAKILRLSDSQVLGMVPMDLCLSSGMDPVADRRETGRMFLHYEFYLDPGAKVLWDQASFAGVMGTENDGFRVSVPNLVMILRSL